MLKKIRNTKLGFTLIELLVVISIIGILSSVILASVKTARNKSKATKFVAEMKSLQNAMALYLEKYKMVPQSGGNDYNAATSLTTALNGLVTDKFIPRIPHAPDWPQHSNWSSPITSYMWYTPIPESQLSDPYGYFYGQVCGKFTSWDQFVRTGQKGVLVMYTRNPDFEDLKMNDDMSYCYKSFWGQGCWAYSDYSVVNDGQKYYCVSF